MRDIEPDHRIVIDVGSSFTHTGLVDAARRVCLRRIDFPSRAAAKRLPAALLSLQKKSGRDCGIPVILAATGKKNCRAFLRILKRGGIRPVIRLACRSGLPVRFPYENRQSLGADRIAGALYAAALFPGRNAIIIDAGTAITVDVVTRKSAFAGGAIMPGVSIQFEALRSSTATLPLLTAAERPVPPIGASTAACMRAGVMHGTAGALNHLVGRYRSLLGGNCAVLATGGGWRFLRNFVDFKHTFVRDLTLIGAALFTPSRRAGG